MKNYKLQIRQNVSQFQCVSPIVDISKRAVKATSGLFRSLVRITAETLCSVF